MRDPKDLSRSELQRIDEAANGDDAVLAELLVAELTLAPTIGGSTSRPT